MTPEERKAYQDYEARQEREAALQAKRQERENREARKAARKKAEQDAARAAPQRKRLLTNKGDRKNWGKDSSEKNKTDGFIEPDAAKASGFFMNAAGK